MPPDIPDNFESRWRQRFEHFGRTSSSEARIAGWSQNGLASRLRAFERHCGSVSGCWLDAGCGAGSYVRLLRRRGAEQVCGADYSAPSLAKARWAVADDAAVAWVAADVRQLPFANGHFDGTLCFGVTQTLAESTVLIGELVRVTQAGGEIWVDGLNDLCMPDRAWRIAKHMVGRAARLRLESARELRNKLLKAGCHEADIAWVPILPERIASLQHRTESAGLAAIPVLAPALSHAFLIRARR